jgi:hypothetical protein
MLEAPDFCHQQIPWVPCSLENFDRPLACLNGVSVTAQLALIENDAPLLRIDLFPGS